jgi:hypothetical protein
MTIYWLLFAFPALMALSYPRTTERGGFGLGQGLALLVFLVFYTVIGALRFEVGGDWEPYLETFEDISTGSLGYALISSDPAYGLLNWLSSRVDGGIYLVNGVCCWILGYGLISAATRLRDPWLALTIAVPYLLIVVGLGYVRQGAAIGLIMLALAHFDQGRTLRTIACLVLAVLFHSAAIMVLPLFAFTMVRGNVLAATAFAVIGVIAYFFLLAPRLDRLEAGYLEAEYESGGAMARVMMGLLPALLVLLLWKRFPAGEWARPVWLGMAMANVLAMAALVLSPSSTAVDRVALFFAPIQLAAFGEIRALLNLGERLTLLVRLALIGLAALVQTVWLVFATHADLWVPYTWLFDA